MIKKLFQSKPLTATPEESMRRNVAVRITLITGLLLFAASVPTLVTSRPEDSLQFVGNLITLVMSVVSFVSARIAYRISATRGILLYISTLLLLSLGIPFYANGLGLQSGIIVAVMVISVAMITLPPASASRIIVIAVLVESAVVLLDLYLPDFGLEKLESQYINPFLLVIILVFAYYIFRQYSTYAFRAKLILAFVTVTALAVVAVGFTVNRVIQSDLTSQVGKNLDGVANITASAVGDKLGKEVDKLRVIAINHALHEEVEKANMTSTGDLAEMERLDQQWRAADTAGNNTDPLVQKVLNHQIAEDLHEFQNNFPQHVEVFITDRYGAIIASTDRTTDYFQADEEWWQAAYNDGDGGVFIGQPELDESSQTLGIQLAVPVLSQNDEIVGVLRTTVDLKAFEGILILGHFGESGHTHISLPDGTEIHLQTEPQQGLRIAPARLNVEDLVQSAATALEVQLASGEQHIASQALVTARDDAGMSQIEEAIADLEWRVVAHQSLDEAFAPAENQERTTVTISITALILAALLGYLASQRLVTPIVNLRAVTSEIASGNLHARAEVKTQDEIGALSSAFNLMSDQLQETLRDLERRVADRTSDLNTARIESERRAQDLQGISEISKVISTEQRLDILLPLISRLVSDKFNFYHTGIFLVDENRLFAVLQAANSEGGQRMLNRGHRLELGTGIVGTVALTGKPRIALDVGADAVFFDNPDLPTTRSEMALPLKVGGVTIGVLDVQSTRAGEFKENDVNILGILAEQIAIAIENTRLFSKTQQALDEVQALYNQYLQKEWKALRGKTQNVGYIQTLSGGKPLIAPVETDDIRHAVRTGQTTISRANNGESDPTVIVPIKLRGRIIGVLNIKSAARDREWTRDELNLIQSVTDRLALALENARLFEETSRRAERERLVSEITGKIRSVNDSQIMIQTAVEELRNALGASRVQIIPQTLADTDKTVE